MGCTQTKPVSTPAQSEPTVQIDEEQALDPYLIAEALRVFDLADKDHNGQLDMEELSDVRNSKEVAKAMLGQWDTDLSGTINKEEWLNYFAKSFEKNEKRASIVLKEYEKQIEENNNARAQKATTNLAEPNAEPDPAENIAATNPAEPSVPTTDPIIEDAVAPKIFCCA